MKEFYVAKNSLLMGAAMGPGKDFSFRGFPCGQAEAMGTLTVTVSSGAGDPHWANVVFLLGMNVATLTVFDHCGNTLTMCGSPAVSTDKGVPTVYFNGSSAIELPVGNVHFSSQPVTSMVAADAMTLEAVVHYTAGSTACLYALGTPGSGKEFPGSVLGNLGGFQILINGSGGIELVAGSLAVNGATGYYHYGTSPSALTTGRNEIVITVASGIPSVYVNGASQVLSNLNAVYSKATNLNIQLYIPRNVNIMSKSMYMCSRDTTSTNNLHQIFGPCHIEALRITKGVVRSVQYPLALPFPNF